MPVFGNFFNKPLKMHIAISMQLRTPNVFGKNNLTTHKIILSGHAPNTQYIIKFHNPLKITVIMQQESSVYSQMVLILISSPKLHTSVYKHLH